MLKSKDKTEIIGNLTTKLNTIIVQLLKKELENIDYLPKGKTVNNNFGTFEINVDYLEEYNQQVEIIETDKTLNLTDKVHKHNELFETCKFHDNSTYLQLDTINDVLTSLNNKVSQVLYSIPKPHETEINLSVYHLTNNVFYSQNVNTKDNTTIYLAIIKMNNKYHAILNYTKVITNYANILDLLKHLANEYNVITKLTANKTLASLEPCSEEQQKRLLTVLNNHLNLEK